MGGYFSKSFNPATDMGNLSGKVMIVTGGNTGIGYATIQHLARQGAKIYMGARSEEKAKAAIENLKKEGLGPRHGEVIWLNVDLSDPKKAKKAAEDFLSKEKRLDVLVNNAAMLLGPYVITPFGIQDQMVVNHLSPFVFTTTLLPLLKETAKEKGSDVRIVTLGSDAHWYVSAGVRFRSREDFNDEHAKAIMPSMVRYGRSKLASILFTRELQRRLDTEGSPILALTLHPGNVTTDNSREVASKYNIVVNKLFMTVNYFFFANPKNGSHTSVFAAAAPVVRAMPEKYKYAYLQPVGVLGKPTADAMNDDLAKELWSTTETILQEIGV